VQIIPDEEPVNISAIIDNAANELLLAGG